MCVLVIAGILSVSSCSDGTDIKPKLLEDIAKASVGYSYRLDADGLKILLKKECHSKYDLFGIRVLRRNISMEMEDKNVSFRQKSSHDFSNIGCKLISKRSDILLFNCSGEYRLRDNDGNVVVRKSISKNVPLRSENGEVFFWPSVCDNS